MSAKLPLLITYPGDVNAAAIDWGLRQVGIRSKWVQTLSQSPISPASIGSNGFSRLSASGGLNPDQIGSVMYRRPLDPVSFPGAHSSDLDYLSSEWSRFQSNVYALAGQLHEGLWINEPGAAERAENKLVQLQAASACGVRFPATLVSNDPDEIRQFIADCGRVIHKTFSRHGWSDEAGGRMLITSVELLDGNSQLSDASLRLCPGIFQAYVDKVCDLRVTVIGDRLFVARLDAAAGAAFVDWRAHAGGPNLLASPDLLEESYANDLSALMRELGIVFGCIDIAIDADGTPYFLEVNQAGQFLFIESMNDSFPLLRAMCAILAEGRTDYSMECIPESVSYSNYLNSAYHADWLSFHTQDRKAASLRNIPGVSVEPLLGSLAAG